MIKIFIVLTEFTQLLVITLWEILDISGTNLSLRYDKVGTYDFVKSFLSMVKIYRLEDL